MFFFGILLLSVGCGEDDGTAAFTGEHPGGYENVDGIVDSPFDIHFLSFFDFWREFVEEIAFFGDDDFGDIFAALRAAFSNQFVDFVSEDFEPFDTLVVV